MTTMLPVFSGYMLVAHNECYCEGQYFPEDDWDFETIGDTPEDALTKFWMVYPHIDIIPRRFSMNHVQYVVWHGERFPLSRCAVFFNFDDEKYRPMREQALESRKRVIETIGLKSKKP